MSALAESVAVTLSTDQARPLDRVHVSAPGAARLRVRDGQGRSYHQAPGPETTLVVGGALGSQVISAEDEEGRVLGTAALSVRCETTIRDAGGRFRKLFEGLADTLFIDWHQGYRKGLRIHGKFYRYYVSWIRDHVHALKGMKYFDADKTGIESGIELYADHQREDGMIWDKCKPMFQSDAQTWRDHEFAEGDFIRKVPGNPRNRWQRIPVENDVEYLFLEGLYYTWKAVGDTAWMSRHLDQAIKAVRYSTSDRYRWSPKLGLLKRGYTIDTWDFQHAEDKAISGSAMRVDPDQTRFNAFHGDNTGMAVGCRYLAEMLRAAGRDDEAKEFDRIADELKQRLDQVAWNGRFYTHMVPEDPSVQRDCGGTDEATQVSQSNAYNLNRRIDHEQCVAIIDTYQRIRDEMPESSAGEFYGIYPPFEQGFGHSKWNYMNGGVTTICAGELAHGAFEHGRETYAADILQRLLGWSERLGGYLECCLKGCMPEEPDCSYTPIDLSAQANCVIDARSAGDALCWGEGDNDFRNLPTGAQTLLELPFAIPDPASNDGKAVALLSHAREGAATQLSVPIGSSARTIYLLHTTSGGQGPLTGWFTLHYADGGHRTQYVHQGAQVGGWFMPPSEDPNQGGNQARKQGDVRLAWQGPNGTFDNVGIQVLAWKHPEADRAIERIDFTVAETGVQWAIAGITLSDGPAKLPTSPVSYGIPDMWGAAAVLYALIEGLGGVVDTGVAFDRLELSPRWAAADETEAEVAVTYPASGGYAAYRYRQEGDAIQLELSANATQRRLRVLLPAGKTCTQAEVDGEAVTPAIEQVEDSRYACLDLTGPAAQVVVLRLG